MRRATGVVWLAVLIIAAPSIGAGSALAVCGDGFFDAGESCDDGNIESGDGCSAACHFEPRDRYKCYKVKRKSAASARPPVGLADRFGVGAAIIGKPVALCTPVDMNRSGIIDRSTTLLCYRIDPTLALVDRQARTVILGNEFGGRILTATRPRSVCVPSVPIAGLIPTVLPCGNGIVDGGEECDDGNTTGGDGCSAGCRREPTQHYACYKAKVRRGSSFAPRELALADAFESTRMTAQRSVRLCVPTNKNGEGVRDVTIPLECFKLRRSAAGGKSARQEVTVRNQFGTERVTVLKPRTLCVPSGEPVSSTAPDVDAFKCYAAKTTKGTPRFVSQTRRLTDVFETKDVKVTAPTRICNPASGDAAGIGDPTAHLTCYGIANVKGQTRTRLRDVVVYNEFGAQTLKVRKPKMLCTPTAIAPVPSGLAVDRFKCYAAEPKKDGTTHRSRKMRLTDLFETKRTVIRSPTMFCTPVDENGQGIRDIEAHLTCYRIGDVEGQPVFTKRDVALTNAFGDARLTVQDSATFCVPSRRVFDAPRG
jgi:cysteine-rich repeat protein